MKTHLVKLLAIAGAGLVLAGCWSGCTSFSNQTWRTEQTAVDVVYGGYTVWTNYYVTKTNAITTSPDTLAKLNAEETQVKKARQEFAATVGVVEAWRAAYSTNSAVQSQVTAALNAVLQNSSNIVYLINFYRNQP